MFGKNKNIGIICNDAGTANIIIYWIKKYKYNYLIKATGPAKKIFLEIIPKLKFEKKLSTVIKKSDLVISGTSAKSNIDHKARYLSKENKKKVIGLLDHWTLYKEGFTYKNKVLLPDEIWVTNKKAFNIAKKQFKKKILLKKNLLEYYVSRLKQKKNYKNFLYILEPLNKKVEFKILSNFLDFIKKNNLQKKINLIFKIHPSENMKKYKNFISKNYKSNYQIINSNNIIKIIGWSDVVFGLRSYALVLALKAKRKVFTLLPVDNFKFTLPYKQITTLNSNAKKNIVKNVNDIKY